mmetsp:Transcript_148031/g.258170  ORF Transcript_148031/g.258170 Transcript_148031/m.258170 type:complete len:333 (+) Transcript_148031:33-1031(+)
MLYPGLNAASLAEALESEAVADSAFEDERLADDWDAWAARWESEFQRMDNLEEKRRAASEVRARSEVLREAGRAQLEAAAAKMRKMEDALEDVRREQQKAELRADAARARKEVASAAQDSCDDLVAQISANAARRRREADEKLKKKREAAREAEWKKFHEGQYVPKGNPGAARPPSGASNRTGSASAKPPGGASDRAGSASNRAGSASRGSGSRASSQSRASSKPRAPTLFTSFAEFDAAWAAFEKQVAAGVQGLRFLDVPWPVSLPTVSGVEPRENLDARKRKLRAALVRWHPDKWSKVLDCIHEADRGQVVERVKEVTRRIIDEKKLYGS